MFNQFFSQPLVFSLNQSNQFRFWLRDDVSDFILLQLIHAPLAEVIVSENDGRSASITIRQQPFLQLDPLFTDASELLEIHRQHDSGAISRSLGQGLRLYIRLGIAPSMCTAALRQGLILTVSHDGQCYFKLAQVGKIDLVPLEHDLRIYHEPRELMMAKALLARQYDYQSNSQMLAIYITELEQVQRDLISFLNGETGKIHPGFSSEAIALDAMIQKKRQWLMRTYNQSLERPSYSRSANELDELERLKRTLECYELLAPPELTERVRQVADDSE